VRMGERGTVYSGEESGHVSLLLGGTKPEKRMKQLAEGVSGGRGEQAT
jgi:hypothetical protein